MTGIKLKCIAVDDEPMALDIMRDYIDATPFLELDGAFHRPIDALTFMQSNQVHLLFTDISMPSISGLQFIKSLPYKPLCILTTAHSEYALDGYDLDVIDYLLKPIEFDRFIKAATKAFQLFQLKLVSPQREVKSADQNYLLVKSGKKTHQLKIGEVLWVEASGNYITFNLVNSKIMSLMNIKDVEALLPHNQFLRTHRSFIISKEHVETIQSHEVLVSGRKIPISKSYRKKVLNQLLKA